MALSLIERDVTFAGPALPEAFVKFQLDAELNRLGLLAKTTGAEGKALQERWEPLRRRLRELGDHGGVARVRNQVIEPLIERLGWSELAQADEVRTREGDEDGGWLLRRDEALLRVFIVPLGTDLDAPSQRGEAYRFSPARVAERVLLASKERLGLLTDGIELRLVLPDPAGRDSYISIALRGPNWRSSREVPDSYRLLLALASPKGVAAVPELIEKARLAQTGVTKKLRDQAKNAILRFVQEVLDQPANAAALAAEPDRDVLAHALWRESLIVVYRLLFILKLESDPDPARAFRFAATRPWRQTYSPNLALAPIARLVLDEGADTGRYLEDGLRSLFRMFAEGVRSNELHVSALGGALFGPASTPWLTDRLQWGERAVANVLDCLLWTPSEGRNERERVHYGALDVEDLGRVYEALLELDPGIAAEPMCRLRRAKLEVVVPLSQGARYRSTPAGDDGDDEDGEQREADDEAGDDSGKRRGGKTRVEWIEEIPAGRFYARVGLGRKASGSYYTPHPFVRFLVEETLGPQIAERSPAADPRPAAILELKVLDPAMGSGHFLVEACRYLGAALYEACRLCDERAFDAERKAEAASGPEKESLLGRATALRQRVLDLPDPNDELLAYLPSRATEGEASGLSQRTALALCRRLVTVHCLYGIDKNGLAVELAKVALWLESYAEGLPLTFLDHRLICGDSLTGPMLDRLFDRPVTGDRVQDVFLQGLEVRVAERIQQALGHVRELDATVGKDLADLELKRMAKAKLDEALAPLRLLAQAWSGAAMLGQPACDDAYAALADVVAHGKPHAALGAHSAQVERMLSRGGDGVSYDLTFPEVFHPDGAATRTGGFHAVLGNPPWDAIRRADDQFFARYDLQALVGATKREKTAVQKRLLGRPEIDAAYRTYVEGFEAQDRVADRLFESHQARVNDALAGRGTYDAYMLFAERGLAIAQGRLGFVLPSGFHANEGATGLRRTYFGEERTLCCYSFENKKKLFEIHSSFKFAVVVAAQRQPGRELRCRFYLHDAGWLFERADDLRYSLEFIERTGGDYLSLLELRSAADVAVASMCFAKAVPFGAALRDAGVVLSQEVNMTYDAERFSSAVSVHPGDSRIPEIARHLLAQGYVPLHEGKTFHQFDDRWGNPPRYLLSLSAVHEKSEWLRAAQCFRLCCRAVASSTNERTVILAFVPPGALFGHSALAEKKAYARPSAAALSILAMANSHLFDWNVRQRSGANVSLFILNGCPLPPMTSRLDRFLAHAALRLATNHAGYALLWREQLGSTWREPSAPESWPVLSTELVRWQVRAEIDAVVAHAYGLDRAQYEHVLASFSHSSFLLAPELCLRAYDDVVRLGLDAFIAARDPYADIPLVTTLPTPVLDLLSLASVATDAALETAAAEAPVGGAVDADAAPWLKRTATDRALLIACRAADRHGRHAAKPVLGNVKLEKILHLVEAHCGIDLERKPVREAAGPADFPRLQKLRHRATMTNALQVEGSSSGVGAVWSAGRSIEKQLRDFETFFGPVAPEIDRVLGLLVPLEPDGAEIAATLYAAWNDLLYAGSAPSDEQIIEDFYVWAPGKRQFSQERLTKALAWMRANQLVPTGSAKQSEARQHEQFGLLGGDAPAPTKRKTKTRG